MAIRLFKKNEGNCLQRNWFRSKTNNLVARWGKHSTLPLRTHLLLCCFDSVPDHFQSWRVSWHTGQRSLGATRSSDRPATVRGCWWINKRSRKRGLRIRSHSISEGSAQPISLLPGTMSTTTLWALYNCCFLGHKQVVFITAFYSLVLSLERKKSSSNCHISLILAHIGFTGGLSPVLKMAG